MKFVKAIFREILARGARWQSAADARGVYFRPFGKRAWAFVSWDALSSCYGDSDVRMDLRPGEDEVDAASSEPSLAEGDGGA